ncbi:Bromodomain-containing protein 8 [Rhizophlyctis rosea]|nr:Bromodomain-containing protein 8 [Rhizophlyctis rosea]
MPPVVKLARKLHMDRIAEIKAKLKEDEAQFRALLLEVEEIRSGRWDNKFRQQLDEEQKAATAETEGIVEEKSQETDQTNRGSTDSEAAAMELDAGSAPVMIETGPQPMETDVPDSAATVKADQPQAEANQMPHPPETIDVQMAEAGAPEESNTPQAAQQKEVEKAMDLEPTAFADGTTLEVSIASRKGDEATPNPEDSSVDSEEPESTETPRAGSASPVKSPRKAGRPPKLRLPTPANDYGSPDIDDPSAEPSDVEKKRALKVEEKSKIWRKTTMMIWNKIADHRFGNVFLKPIKEEGYSHFVKQPMNLDLIKARIRDGTISTTAEFHRDVLLCFTNALMYNNEDTGIYEMAMEMREFADAEIRHLILYGDRDLSSNTRRHKSAEVDVEQKGGDE